MTTSLTLNQLDQSWAQFSNRIIEFAEQLDLIDCKLECDHVALRVNSTEAATAISKGLCQRGQLISSNMINGRPIEIIELANSLSLGDWLIPCVELPYPSDKHYPEQGWEHIELVLPCEAQDYDDLAAELVRRVPSLANVIEGKTEIEIKKSSPKGDKERLANPTIAFKSKGVCIKIHSHGIKAIIASERTE